MIWKNAVYTPRINSLKYILKDIGVFYLSVIASYGVLFFFVWLFTYLSLESHKIDSMSDFDTYNFSDTLPLPIEVSLEKLEKIKYFVFIISALAAFFSLPPKSFFHILICAALMFLINTLLLTSGTLPERIYMYIPLLLNVLAVWLLSHAWQKIKKSDKRTGFLNRHLKSSR